MLNNPPSRIAPRHNTDDMMNIPTIAVLLAAYNGEAWIGEQLDTILNQKEVEVTIFVSIDPSTDHTANICQEYSKRHPNIIILADAGKYGGAAKNFFRLMRDVNISGFDYVSFSDQDDIWYPDKLARGIKLITQQQLGGYSSNVLAFWPQGAQKVIVKSQPQRLWDYLFEAAGPGCTYVFSAPLAAALKQSIVKNWLQINDLGLHDWYSYAFARAHGYKWLVDPEPSMLYRQHSSNQVGVNKGWAAFRYRINKVTQGWGIRQAAMVAALVGKGDDAFVTSWSGMTRYGFLKLALSANQCRRKSSERVFFFLACLIMVVLGTN
jgi:rhamnosyltransferase